MTAKDYNFRLQLWRGQGGARGEVREQGDQFVPGPLAGRRREGDCGEGEDCGEREDCNERERREPASEMPQFAARHRAAGQSLQ